MPSRYAVCASKSVKKGGRGSSVYKRIRLTHENIKHGKKGRAFQTLEPPLKNE